MDTEYLCACFDENQADLLVKEWTWLLGEHKLPILITSLGDAFLQDLVSQAVYYLNLPSADLMMVASSIDELSERLADEDFITEHFAPEFVVLLQQSYGVLADGDVYSLDTSCVSQTQIGVEDMDIVDVLTHFQQWGQVHQAHK